MPPKTKQDDDTATQATAGSDSAETQVADALGVGEGEVKQLRYEAGLDMLAGHEANVHAYEASVVGQEFLKAEKDRVKAEEASAKEIDGQTDKDGIDPGAAKYIEALDKARKGK